VLRGGSPEFVKFGTPGVKLTGAWVKKDQQDMANTSGHSGWVVWDRTWLATVRGSTGLPASQCTQFWPRFGLDSALGSIYAMQLTFPGLWIGLDACGAVRLLWHGGAVNHGEAFYAHGGIEQGNEGFGVSLTTTGSYGGTTLV
jgi:hypothetical protein